MKLALSSRSPFVDWVWSIYRARMCWAHHPPRLPAGVGVNAICSGSLESFSLQWYIFKLKKNIIKKSLIPLSKLIYWHTKCWVLDSYVSVGIQFIRCRHVISIIKVVMLGIGQHRTHTQRRIWVVTLPGWRVEPAIRGQVCPQGRSSVTPTLVGSENHR